PLSRRAVLFGLIGVPVIGQKVALGNKDIEKFVENKQDAVMSKSDELAKATVRIVREDGAGLGSGFHFIRPDIIVSNAPVVEPLIDSKATLHAEAETGEHWPLAVLAHSPPAEFDYAIMRANGSSFDHRQALRPDDTPIGFRGKKLLYAGYPHGIDPLL